MSGSEYVINDKWKPYYRELEQIRKEGICNMWGSAPILSSRCGITRQLATDVLMSWISNYAELSHMYGWRD